MTYFLEVSIVLFLFINKALRLNNIKTRTAMDAKISVFVICVKAIIYLLLYNLHDCTFKKDLHGRLFPFFCINNCFKYILYQNVSRATIHKEIIKYEGKLTCATKCFSTYLDPLCKGLFLFTLLLTSYRNQRRI